MSCGNRRGVVLARATSVAGQVEWRCALVRWAAVEAVQRQCEPCVRELREQNVARRGRSARNIAKVAAAHRMLDLVYYTLRGRPVERAMSCADRPGVVLARATSLAGQD